MKSDRTFTCIVCPLSCEIETTMEDGVIVRIEGNKCKKGEAYVRQELIDPKRNIATSIQVIGGDLPLASVKTSDVIPKDRIFDVMREISKLRVEAPVNSGDKVIENILGLDVDIVVTKTVDAREVG